MVLAVLLAKSYRDRAERSLQESARLLGYALDAELQRSVSALEVLGESEALARGDLRAFYDLATRTRDDLGIWDNVLLLSPKADHLLNLRRPYGSALPPLPQPEGTLAAARTRKPYFSDVLRGRVETDWLVYMTVPVVIGGEVRYVIGATMSSKYWSRWLTERAPRDVTASIVGRDLNVLARTADVERTLGKPVAPWYQDIIRVREHGFGRGEGMIASELVSAWQRSRISGWTVNLFTSAAIVDQPMWRTVLLLAAGIAATVALVVGLAFTRGRALSRAAGQVQRALESLRGTRPSLPPPTTPVAEFNAALVAAADTARVLESRGQALQEADRRKDEFLATLAHELRGPMAPIRNATEILRLRGGGDEAAVIARDIIHRQVEHMRRLVDDLLDVARISRGQIRIERRPVELAPILEGAIEATRPLIERAGIHVEVDATREPLWVDADRTRLVQVLTNLLANSAKFTPKGGHAWVSARREGDFAVLEVRDDGAGIDPADLPRVFDMFSQAGAGSERAADGLGIGLALVKGLVEQHGGSVAAASEGRGRGAAFTVRLPLVPGAAAAGPAPARVAARPASGRRILVADDLADTADSLARLLRLQGHEVFVANDGAEALGIASRLKPDLAILDIGMPKMSGYEVAQGIRREPWGRDMVLVAISGWGRAGDREKAAEAGFDFHLTKPADPARIQSILAARVPS